VRFIYEAWCIIRGYHKTKGIHTESGVLTQTCRCGEEKKTSFFPRPGAIINYNTTWRIFS